MEFQLRTLGAVDLRTAEGVAVQSLVAQPKRLALLVYLALAAHPGFVRRDVLIGLFWPDLDQQHARTVLRKTIFHIRQSLGSGTVVGRGEDEVALGPGAVWCDVTEMKELLRDERAAEALALYRGDLLEGFFLHDTPGFEQWLEIERADARRRAATAAWKAAGAEEAAGRIEPALGLARRAVALSPDDDTAVRRLLSLLDRAGDRAGALRLYEDHRCRLDAEFGMEPAPETSILLESIRSRDHVATRVARLENGGPDAGHGVDPEAEAGGATRANTSDEGVRPRAAGSAVGMRARWRAGPWGLVLAAVPVLALLATGIALTVRDDRLPTDAVLAIGDVKDFGPSDQDLVPVVRELLSTRLSQVPGLSVVSNARLFEMLGGYGYDGRASLLQAARRSGATEVVEGALYELPDGRLRFDLRRAALGDGAVSGAVSVEGADVFAVVDAAANELAEAFGLSAPLPTARRTAPPLAAYRLYEQGLRAYYLRGDATAALSLFKAAVATDSTFAMAAYYAGEACLWVEPSCHALYLGRARRMADRATPQERLLISATFSEDADDPAVLAVADSLASLYPDLPEGHRILGVALKWDGRFLEGARHLREAFRLDSIPMLGHAPRCTGCDALAELAAAYMMADSMPAAERAARTYVRMLPGSSSSWNVLASVLDAEGLREAASEASRKAQEIAPSPPLNYALANAGRALRFGSFADADEILAKVAAGGDPALGCEAEWWRVYSYRDQGRLRDALASARRLAVCGNPGDPLLPLTGVIVLFASGRYVEAARKFREMATVFGRDTVRSKAARNRGWFLTQAAASLVAAGHLEEAAALADTIEALGPFSAYGRDRLLHNHVRGLIALAKGRPDEAEALLRQAIYSPVSGYTRTNLALGRLLLARGRATEAISIVRPALSGPLDASNLYVSRTELHELLALAFDAAGEPDSAAVHYAAVANAWQRADPRFQTRRAAASSRLAYIRSPSPPH